MRPSRLLRAFTGALLAVLPVARPARAQSASDAALAETLFRDGRALMAAGHLDEACGKLEASQRIDPKIGTLTNLAECHEQQGKTASAWGEFTEAAAMASTMKRPKVETFAHEHAVLLEARLSRLTLVLSQPADTVQVTLDGKAIAREAMGVAIPLDPGEHALEAHAGSASWSARVVIAPGPASQDVTIPRLEAPPVEPATPAEVPAPPPAAPPPEPERAVASLPSPETPPSGGAPPWQRTLAITAFAAGGVSLALGGYFGLRTLSKKSDGDALCQGAACTPQGYDLEQQASHAATASTIFFGVGIALSGAGAALLLVHRSAPRAAIRWEPLVTPRGAAMSIRSSW